MPSINFGFDVANPTKWDVVKGFSAVRYFERTVENRYSGGSLDFAWDLNDQVTLKFGGAKKNYSFFTTALQRESARETLNPSLLEAGVNIRDMGSVFSFGQGLNLPDGTPTSFFAPDLDAFRRVFDFECNCVNKWNDWRISTKFNFAQTFTVEEDDTSYYAQADFNLPIFGRTLRGNAGLRRAETGLTSSGFTNRGRAISATNDYANTLPSINLAYEIADDMIIRFGAASVMARPLLGNLAPSVTAFTVPNGLGATSGGSITVGNPNLKPFMADQSGPQLRVVFPGRRPVLGRGLRQGHLILPADPGRRRHPDLHPGRRRDRRAAGRVRSHRGGYDPDRRRTPERPEPGRLHHRRSRLRHPPVP